MELGCTQYFAADGKPNDVAGLLDEVVRLRNLVRHSVATPAEQTERMRRLQTSLRDTLLTMDWLTGYRPFESDALLPALS
ncbi:MAG: hypothetical protein ACXW5U_02310 [Thermoanaerobaculia bacterium]